MSEYHLTCRHCGCQFLETVDLLFHHCAAQGDAQKPRRNAKRSAGQGKVRTKAQRPSPAGEGVR